MEKIEIIEENFNQKCTGCGACKNICPVGAIELVEGYHTFCYPVIDEKKCIKCGRCKHVCPVNNYENQNEKTPELFAARSNDEIRKKSSSGGMFFVFAKKIIELGGVVYGVTLTEKLSVEFVRIDKIKDIIKCQGSKYVQANTKFSFKEAKADLDSGKYVLFVGTPCQIQGFKNFLGKPYEKLISVDIVCHGVPSQKVFTSYLEEKNKNEIKSVEFRDKANGWRSDILTIDYKNKNEKYSKSLHQGDEYEIGFQENIILRDSCENCKFCEFPRVGDLSIGDFWGVETFLENDGKGTSMLFVNNKKGKSFVDLISKNEFCMMKKMDISFDLIKNRMHAFYPHHKEKGLFFEMIKGNSFSKSIECAKQGKYDVAIVGIPTVENFGGTLTYVGLYHAVKELGKTVFLVERPTSCNHPPAPITNVYYKSPFSDTKIVDNLPTKKNFWN